VLTAHLIGYFIATLTGNGDLTVCATGRVAVPRWEATRSKRAAQARGEVPYVLKAGFDETGVDTRGSEGSVSSQIRDFLTNED